MRAEETIIDANTTVIGRKAAARPEGWGGLETSDGLVG